MTTELEIQEKIQGVIQGLNEFADADVVINDWSIFDRPNVEAPYVIIRTSDDFDSVHEVMTPMTLYAIPIVLVEEFTDWKETLDKFQERRQAIIDEFNSDDSRSASGLDVYRMRADSPIDEFYDKLIPADQIGEALPVFIMQQIILEVRIF